MKPTLLLMILAALLSSKPAQAQSPSTPPSAPSPTAHRHDGFFLRVGAGGAQVSAAKTINALDLGVSSPSGAFAVTVGGTIARNLALGVELMSYAATGPTFSLNGTEVGSGDDVQWGVSFAGINATYYLNNNIYFSGSVGAARMTLDAPATEAQTGSGFGANLGIGKEWWVSPQWGIGGSVQAFYANVPEDDGSWSVTGFGLALSATYN